MISNVCAPVMYGILQVTRSANQAETTAAIAPYAYVGAVSSWAFELSTPMFVMICGWGSTISINRDRWTEIDQQDSIIGELTIVNLSP
jgi:hypothetical protein